ncbi:unnamed protein product [Bubo scandiacus]
MPRKAPPVPCPQPEQQPSMGSSRIPILCRSKALVGSAVTPLLVCSEQYPWVIQWGGTAQKIMRQSWDREGKYSHLTKFTHVFLLGRNGGNISLGLVHAQSVELITLVSHVSSCKT